MITPPAFVAASTPTPRDKYGQLDGPWTDRDYQLLSILEEVASPDENPDKSLAAYMADIYDLFR